MNRSTVHKGGPWTAKLRQWQRTLLTALLVLLLLRHCTGPLRSPEPVSDLPAVTPVEVAYVSDRPGNEEKITPAPDETVASATPPDVGVTHVPTPSAAAPAQSSRAPTKRSPRRAGASASPPSLPPFDPPDENTLYLDLVLNGIPTGKVVPVLERLGRLHLRHDDLLAAGVRPLPRGLGDSEWLDLAGIPGVEVTYDPNSLLLQLTVPIEWLPLQQIGRGSPHYGALPRSDRGFLFNYDLHHNRQSSGASGTALWLEQRAFGGFGVLSNTGVWRRHPGLGGRDSHVRYDTTWTRQREDRLISWSVGDVITAAQSWSSSVRLGGVKIARDFRLRPDLITFPLPEYAGQAAVPTTVDLILDGKSTITQTVQPGPFTITDIPVRSGAGMATIITTDALGRQVSTSLPFYVSSDLLKRGFLDYAGSAGALRRGYGTESFDYGQPAATGSLRYGLRDGFTIEGHTELAESLAVFGIGGVIKAGLAGVTSFAAMASEEDGTRGWQYELGHRYTNGLVTVGYQGTTRTDGFRNLAGYGSSAASMSRRSQLFTAGLSLGRTGSVNLGYFSNLTLDQERSRLLNLSYTRPWHGNGNFHVSMNRDLERGLRSITAQFTMTLGNASTLRTGSYHDEAGIGKAIDYLKRPPTSGGFGWAAGYADPATGSSRHQASIISTTRFARFEAGTFRSDNHSAESLSAAGSLIAMDGHWFAAQRVSDAFVVVSTDGIPDVAVRQENRHVGRTNRNGHLLVPWVSSYYPARYEIDALDLPSFFRTDVVEERVSVRRGSGALLRFPLEAVVAATVSLVDNDGEAVPVGSVATETTSGAQSLVGHDGLVYFEGLQHDSRVSVQYPDGHECQATFSLPATSPQRTHFGQVVCQ